MPSIQPRFNPLNEVEYGNSGELTNPQDIRLGQPGLFSQGKNRMADAFAPYGQAAKMAVSPDFYREMAEKIYAMAMDPKYRQMFAQALWPQTAVATPELPPGQTYFDPELERLLGNK